MKSRLLFLVRFFVTLLLLFVTQKVVFMLVNMGHADGAPFGSCIAALWHGLRLDVVTASYLVVLPLAVLIVSCFFRRNFPLRRVLVPYYWGAALLMAIVFVADVVLYSFWGAKIDAADLMYAAKPKEMLASVRWWSVVVGALVVAAVVWHYFRRLRHATPEAVPPLKTRWGAMVPVLLVPIVFLGMRGSVSQSTANPSYAYFSPYAFCNHAALNPLFNMMHSLLKTEDLEHEFAYLPADEAEALVAPCFATDGAITDTLLAVSRPDILLVVWEGGCSEMVMNDSVGSNMMRLSREGVTFTNCYANSFRTDRGLVALLSGWPGLPTTSLMKRNDMCHKLPRLAGSLRDAGYATRFVYGGDVDFTNMRGYLHENGFQHVMGSESFPQSRHLSNWGAPDAYTLQPSVLGFRARRGQPSFTAVLTLSSHEPWEVPMRRLDDNRRNAFAYTDSCIGALVDSLRATPFWDSLLIIIVPDHGVPLQSGQSTAEPAIARIPMLWIGGAVRSHREVDAFMNQSDMAATLLAQLGIDAPEFVFSRNLFSPRFAACRHFVQHVFKNGCNLIDSAGITRLDCLDGSTMTVQGDPIDDDALFVKALVQYIYQRTAKL